MKGACLAALLSVLHSVTASFLRNHRLDLNEDIVCQFSASSEKLQGVQKTASTSNILFQWHDVVVAEDDGSRYLLFLHDKDMGKCSEQALVNCQGESQSSDSVGSQNLMVGLLGLHETSLLNDAGTGNVTNDSPAVNKCSASPCNAGPKVALNYVRSMLAAAWMYSPHASSVAVLGIGGGMIPSWIQNMRPDVQRLDAIDINSAVLHAASCFGLHEGHGTHLIQQDGRDFLSSQPGNTYDVVLLDVFTQREVIPGCLSTQEDA
eukprot:gnl/MRDRNA2_/MRDRNA2_65012_c0_seq1.p1 gnl/MRDRNA2_/MRDRNA2_65012_c0~~gnl/MRDRNA2_/MRDRNA2_65012_c0_seq1.p1  ORF type:complete len:263 (-),score=45.58 gnl/MRDRNA2_/MRDRNA2_65012_c0_seq1:51-839(-)